MKFATKLILWHRPPHLRRVAAIPWEIENSNFCKYSADIEQNAKYCILIASNFVVRPQMLIFSVLKNGASFRILIAIKIFHVTVLLVIYFCDQFWHQKFVAAGLTAVFVNNQHRIQRWGQDFNLKTLYLEGYTANRLTDELPEKSWTKLGVNKLLKHCGT